METNCWDEAVKEAGGPSAVAERLGVTRQTLYRWRKKVPAERLPDVAKAIGLPKGKLRPDICGADE